MRCPAVSGSVWIFSYIPKQRKRIGEQVVNIGWVQSVSDPSARIFVPEPAVILEGSAMAPLPNGWERASEPSRRSLDWQSTFVNGDVPPSNARGELVNRRTWWRLVTEPRTAMGTQKPEEWANSLITRFEEQVHQSCDSSYESVWLSFPVHYPPSLSLATPSLSYLPSSGAFSHSFSLPSSISLPRSPCSLLKPFLFCLLFLCLLFFFLPSVSFCVY